MKSTSSKDNKEGKIKDFWYYLEHKDWAQDMRTGWFHNIKNGRIKKFCIVLK